MKHVIMTIAGFLIWQSLFAQGQEAKIDSLVMMMRTAGREWNNYSKPLIEIGEPAVDALINNAKDNNLSQWNRRISIMTLNEIHSDKWIKPALTILLDNTEDPVLRNQVVGGIYGSDLSHVKDELWDLFVKAENQFHKSNLANLLITADTALAWKAFTILYKTQDGHIQKNALVKMASLRPYESTALYLNGIQSGDWMTGNLAMDSLVNLKQFKPEKLLSLYHQSDVGEELLWRITYVFGHRSDPENIPLLIEAMQNKSWLVHTEAAVCLCRFQPNLVIPQMEKLSDHSACFVKSNSDWVNRQIKKRN